MDNQPARTSQARLMVILGRGAIMLSLLALLGAWTTQLTGTALFGLRQEHIFNDAIVLALLGLAFFVDAFWHARGI